MAWGVDLRLRRGLKRRVASSRLGGSANPRKDEQLQVSLWVKRRFAPFPSKTGWSGLLTLVAVLHFAGLLPGICWAQVFVSKLLTDIPVYNRETATAVKFALREARYLRPFIRDVPAICRGNSIATSRFPRQWTGLCRVFDFRRRSQMQFSIARTKPDMPATNLVLDHKYG
jgi:hypothetical protein